MLYKQVVSPARPGGSRAVKAVDVVEFKADSSGRFEAVIATYDVVDLDGDVVVPGAIAEGAPVAVSPYGHASMGGQMPAGRATVHTVGREAHARGKFFLDTTAGRDTYTVVREMGEAQQWSWGFDIVDFEHGTRDGQRVRVLKSVLIYEVSPVLRGASIGTRTIAAKTTQPADLSDLAVIRDRVRFTRIPGDLRAVAANVRARQELARFEQMRTR